MQTIKLTVLLLLISLVVAAAAERRIITPISVIGPNGKTYTITDPDKDGWGEFWCQAYGINHRDRSIDSDGDGLTDYVEMLYGTEPKRRNPPPRDPTAAEIAQAERNAAATRVAQEIKGAETWQREFAPWAHTDDLLPDGSGANEASRAAITKAKLLAISDAQSQKAAQDKLDVADFARRTGFPTVIHKDGGGVTAIVEMKNGIPRAYTTQNAASADTVSTDELWPGGNTGLSLTGTNVNIGLWDGGDVRISHQEFSSGGVRVFDVDGVSQYGTPDHPTHVTGTLSAYGVTTAARGMSHRAKVFAADFFADLAEMPGTAATNAIRVSNHSYSLQVGWGGTANIGGTNYPVWWGDHGISVTQDYHIGFYDSTARSIDSIAYTAGTYLPVWAAGNERGSAGLAPPSQPVRHIAFIGADAYFFDGVTRPNDGDTGGYDLLPPQAVAKNVLTVGAVSNIVGGYAGSNSVGMSTFSSFGPTDDGRIKPDVVADGVNLLSTGSLADNDYFNSSGTSMATPSVAGSIGLLLQLHTQFYGTNQPPLASTLKGLVINTADEAGGAAGPDYRFGWGLLNARTAALLISNNFASQSLAFIKEVRLPSGDYIEFPVVATNTQPLKVTISWTDPPGTPTAASLDPTNQMLINDLDLRIIAPNGTTNFPRVLDPVNRTNAATNGDNIRDNVEQIAISIPTNGTYTVRVTHKGNLVNDTNAVVDQRVSLVLSGNVPQAVPPLDITQIAQVSSNLIALGWPSVVGRVYEVQYRDDLNSGSWLNASGEISATKTNVAVSVAGVSSLTNRYYRVNQLR